MTCRRVIFEGRVQGVGFRYTVKELARSYEVAGWVRNLSDGNVELVAAGDEDEVAAFLHEIRSESSVAHHIRSHHSADIPVPEGLSGFRIER